MSSPHRRIDRAMPFKDAFNCVKCPRSNDPAANRACPAWWETTWTNDAGETRIDRSCGWTQLPTFLNHMARQANAAAISAQQCRDMNAQSIQTLALAIHHHGETPDNLSNPDFADASIRRRIQRNREDVSTNRGSEQQSRLRHDIEPSDTTTRDGADLLRHNIVETDMVERGDGSLG